MTNITIITKTIKMRAFLKLLLIGLLLNSCTKNMDNFHKYEWILHYDTYDEDYNSTSHQRVLFRNDSAISYSELESKEIYFPLLKTDSTIIFKSQYTISNRDKSEKRDTIIIDTLFYDFKNILNYPVLVVKMIDNSYITILSCSDNKAVIQETNNFLKTISFKIGGFDIGDSISLDLLTDIEDCEDFDCEGIIEAKLKQNEFINIQVIDKKYIYRIEQDRIDEDAVENIVKVVNQKLNMNPDTIIKGPASYTEGFRWKTGELEIELSKSDMTQYYLDEAALQKKTYSGERMRYSYLTLAESQVGHNDEYTLEYDNTVIQTVLKYKQDKKVVSTIIE